MNPYNFESPEILEELHELNFFFQEKKFSPATIKTYSNYTGHFLEWLDKEPEQTTYNDLLQFVNHCRVEGRETRNINMILTAIRHYFTMRDHPNNPASGLYLKGETKTIPNNLLSEEELEQLYENYQVYNERTQRNKVIIGLYIYQGITTDELEKLEPGHLKLQEGKIYIPGTKQTQNKGGRKSRTLKLKANQIIGLQQYLQTRNQTQLFTSLKGSTDLKPSIKALMRDLRKINPQIKDAMQIRKSVIVNWLKAKDIREVQYLAGHSSISSTERYQAANLEELKEAIEKYHPLN